MAGKRPVYRLVIGKKTVGTLWDAVAKSGTNYFSGDIDITSLRAAIKEGVTKQKSVRVDKAGNTELHDTIRVAMFDAQAKGKAGSSEL